MGVSGGDEAVFVGEAEPAGLGGRGGGRAGGRCVGRTDRRGGFSLNSL